MTLPTKVKTWQYSVNNLNTVVPGDTIVTVNQRLLFGIKTALISMATNPWTVVSSSDGVTAGAGDKWLTSANLNWNSAGSAHSWIVLKQTGVAANYQIMLGCTAGTSTTTYNMSIAVSPSAGFTGSSITADPTATDQINLASGALWANGNTIANSVYHVMQSTDGQITRVLITAHGFLSGFWNFERPFNPATGWSNPCIQLLSATGTITSNAATYTLLNGTANSLFRHVSTNYSAYLTSEGFINTHSGGQLSVAPNDLDHEFSFWPIGIMSTTSGARGRHGGLTDLYWGLPGTHPTGTTFPHTLAHTWAQFSHLIFPWNGTRPLVA